MYNDEITLLTIARNQSGADIVETITKEYDVLADIRSVGMKENYEAFSVGLKPELVIVIADYLDYEGQERLIYNDIQYQIIRTYKKSTRELEIVVTR